MKSWEIPMPREDRADGNPHVKIAIKWAGGGRLEFIGSLPRDLAKRVYQVALREPVTEGRDLGIEAAHKLEGGAA